MSENQVSESQGLSWRDWSYNMGKKALVAAAITGIAVGIIGALVYTGTLDQKAAGWAMVSGFGIGVPLSLGLIYSAYQDWKAQKLEDKFSVFESEITKRKNNITNCLDRLTEEVHDFEIGITSEEKEQLRGFVDAKIAGLLKLLKSPRA